MPEIIDGVKYANEIQKEVSLDVKYIEEKYGIRPGLAVILVGEHPPSKIFVKMKEKACEEVGMHKEIYRLPESTSEEELTKLIKKLNEKKNIHGIIVQLPLPKQINPNTVMATISPEKDVDGLNPLNIGNLFLGEEELVPCAPKGIIYLLDKLNIDVAGKQVVVVGHSNLVGKPMAMMLLNRNATVTVCHIMTEDLKKHTREADILIVGAGKKGLIKKDMVKDGVVIFDVGINRVDKKVYGDVDFDDVYQKTSFITPVPGGVGPMTVAMVLKNTIIAAKKILNEKK
ncbi:MAG: bifunctional methylenetetrahydrofolate dehydrogenase/methenyltetrahydrofolate cyclohydrolase FolD [Candidatus Hydrothermarchaeota archaeon]